MPTQEKKNFRKLNIKTTVCPKYFAHGCRIKDKKYLLQIIDNINSNGLPNDSILANVFPNIDNIRGIEAVKLALQKKPSQKQSTKYTTEGLEICFNKNNSKFDQCNLLQTNGTATGMPRSCSDSDLALYRLDKLVNMERINNVSELFIYGRYRKDCLVI